MALYCKEAIKTVVLQSQWVFGLSIFLACLHPYYHHLYTYVLALVWHRVWSGYTDSADIILSVVQPLVAHLDEQIIL